MSKDIAPILAGWDHDPEEIQVRIVSGLDDREKIQLRVDLGLLQMELDDRPDGQRPSGHNSLLDYFETQAKARGSSLTLTHDDCQGLMREGIQYYHRYLALFQLERYDLVIRDTTRNLRLFRFVLDHAEDPADRLQFDQYRPYVIMMRTKAQGLQILQYDPEHVREALDQIDQGIGEIRAFLNEYEQLDESRCSELTVLKRWRVEIERERRVGPIERLEQQLDLAVELEQYEEAARLRDQIARLRGRPPAPSS